MGLDESSWQAVMSAALVGTDRQPFTVPTTMGRLGQLLPQLSNQPEAALLNAAATLALYHRAGWLPEKHPISPTAPCDTDDLPRCSPRVVSFLQQMLQGHYPQVLPEWLAMAAGQRVPELYLPDLLDLGKQKRDLRAAILPVLGKRGQWLAAQNPEWNYAIDIATEADWETGNPGARLLYLQDLRSHHPDRARTLLQTTWDQESAVDRAKFLETFRIGLSMADEPFLEDGLGDRAKDVRRIAADLLASLPASRLCQRMIEYLKPLIHRQEAMKQKLAIAVALPEACDANMQRDGIALKARSGLGERAWWLLQLIGATPLTFWSETWGMAPSEIVKCIREHEWEATLLDGWALAAKRQQRPEWVEAVLDVWTTGRKAVRTVALPDLDLAALLDVLSPDRQDVFLTHFLQFGRGAIDNSLTIGLLRRSSRMWSSDLAQIVLDYLETHFSENNTTNFTWELRVALKEFACLIPISLVSEATKLRTQLANDSPWIQSVEEFLALLQFRQDLWQAFQLRE
jgi:hypothetical protein